MLSWPATGTTRIPAMRGDLPRPPANSSLRGSAISTPASLFPQSILPDSVHTLLTRDAL
jgi:hypothetical protein